MTEQINNQNFLKVTRYDGREILEGFHFNSAIAVQRNPDKTTWLVETMDNITILIEVTEVRWQNEQSVRRYDVYHGKSVEKFKQQYTTSQSNAHHLLMQLV